MIGVDSHLDGCSYFAMIVRGIVKSEMNGLTDVEGRMSVVVLVLASTVSLRRKNSLCEC